MILTKRTMWGCVVVVVISLIFIIICAQSSVVQGIFVGCLSSALVTFVVTGLARYNYKVENCREIYEGLKTIHYNLGTIGAYITEIQGLRLGLSIVYETATADTLEALDYDSALELTRQLENDTIIFNKVKVVSNYIGKSMKHLLDVESKILNTEQVFGDELSERVSRYMVEISAYLVALSDLIFSCRHTAVCCRQTKGGTPDYILNQLIDSANTLTSRSVACLSTMLALSKDARELIAEVERTSAKLLVRPRSWGEEERRIQDMVSISETELDTLTLRQHEDSFKTK